MTRDLDYYLLLDYPYELTKDPEGGWVSSHPDLSGCIAQGESADEAIAELDEARELWLEVAFEDGDPIPEPLSTREFSGRISLRMAPTLHRALALRARTEGVSLNQILNTAVAEYAGRTVQSIGDRDDKLSETIQLLARLLATPSRTPAEPTSSGVLAGIRSRLSFAEVLPFRGAASRLQGTEAAEV